MLFDRDGRDNKRGKNQTLLRRETGHGGMVTLYV